MKITEIFALFAMAALFIVPWFVAGLTIWGILATVILLTVVGFEAYSIAKNDKTISRIFWEFRDEHPKTAYGILTCCSLGWIALVIHLLA